MGMISTLLFDFARVLLFPKSATYQGSLSRMYSKLTKDYSIWNNYELNEELMDFLSKRKSKFQLAILTSSYNLPSHPEIEPKLKNVFKEIFMAKTLPYSKDHSACYVDVIKKLSAQPQNTLFIDDSYRNIEAAAEAGLHVIQYHSNKQLFDELKKYQIS